MSEQSEERSIGKRANELNATVRYTMWSVFRLARPLADEQRSAAADEVAGLIDELAGKDVVVRGTYDVAGFRADADVMVWWHAASADAGSAGGGRALPLRLHQRRVRVAAVGAGRHPHVVAVAAGAGAGSRGDGGAGVRMVLGVHA